MMLIQVGRGKSLVRGNDVGLVGEEVYSKKNEVCLSIGVKFSMRK